MNEEEIALRFFAAIDRLKQENAIRGLKTFCDRYSLNRTRYSRLRFAVENGVQCGYKSVETSALSALVLDYGISGDWLLTGMGKMLR